jgi:predicted nucleic acid-binding protein
VLETAIEGGAEVIVSGDRHLLRLGEWGGVEIVRAAAFVARIGLQD